MSGQLTSPERVIQQREEGGNHDAFNDLVLGVTHCHFCCILFITGKLLILAYAQLNHLRRMIKKFWTSPKTTKYILYLILSCFPPAIFWSCCVSLIFLLHYFNNSLILHYMDIPSFTQPESYRDSCNVLDILHNASRNIFVHKCFYNLWLFP